jgi:hypothetical protein
MQVFAQSTSATPAPSTLTVQDACRSEVSRFEETIGQIRRQSGTAAAAALKEKLLPAKLENEILFKDGYCGLARHIREKGLGSWKQ